MKILLVNYEYPDTTENCGGGGEVTKQLKAGLEARGHRVRVLTDGAGSVEDFGIRGPHTSGHYTTFPLRSKPLLGQNVEWADVVHGHFSLPSSLLLPRYCGRYDTPLVVSVMGADIHDPTRFGWLKPVTKRLNRSILSRADRVVAPSVDMAQRTEAQTGVDPDVIHYGIDADEWEWREKELDETVCVLTVCRLVERKNLRTAYDALQRLRERGTDVEWHIVGTGPQEELVETTHRETDWVWKRGYVEDLQREFDHADLFFLPSKHEAFGMVFLEAIACGLPVVTSSDGGQLDIVEGLEKRRVGYYPGAFIGHTWSDESEAYADLLQQSIEDYGELQTNTEDYVGEHFPQDAMVKQYEELYNNL